jgi:hypothetical protein
MHLYTCFVPYLCFIVSCSLRHYNPWRLPAHNVIAIRTYIHTVVRNLAYPYKTLRLQTVCILRMGCWSFRCYLRARLHNSTLLSICRTAVTRNRPTLHRVSFYRGFGYKATLAMPSRRITYVLCRTSFCVAFELSYKTVAKFHTVGCRYRG